MYSSRQREIDYHMSRRFFNEFGLCERGRLLGEFSFVKSNIKRILKED